MDYIALFVVATLVCSFLGAWVAFAIRTRGEKKKISPGHLIDIIELPAGEMFVLRSVFKDAEHDYVPYPFNYAALVEQQHRFGGGTRSLYIVGSKTEIPEVFRVERQVVKEQR
jgi:hypothetical protein